VLVWITNIPTPYRLPLWLALRDRTALDVACMAETEPNRTWDGASLLQQASAHNLRAPSMRASPELVLYLPTRPLIRLVRTTGSTVVIDGWESPAYLAAAICARAAGNPVVFFYRGTSRSQRFHSGPIAGLRRALFRRADAVLTGGPASTEAVTRIGVRADHIIEGINAVDVEHLASAVAQREHAGQPGHRFLVVGQLLERKNVSGIIDAFARVRDSGDTLTIVGDGPMRESLEGRVTTTGLQDVHFAGHLQGAGLTDAYSSADTLVLASTKEVYGLVVPEALACGLHAVVSTATGVAESVGGMPGVFLSPPTAESLADAMATSRNTWRGPIQNPPIKAMTTDAAAERVMAAVAMARHNRDSS
jgi:glycosyltransferase involved in cell wall biosynthesis